jgi:hypothetical protein
MNLIEEAKADLARISELLTKTFPTFREPAIMEALNLVNALKAKLERKQ